MHKTGESYTAARRMLIAAGERPESAPPAFEPPMSEAAVTAATGLDEAKSRVAIQHERLPDADTAEAMKAWWRERVSALKPLLEEARDA